VFSSCVDLATVVCVERVGRCEAIRLPLLVFPSRTEKASQYRYQDAGIAS
jgi:hypothetical protein